MNNKLFDLRFCSVGAENCCAFPFNFTYSIVSYLLVIALLGKIVVEVFIFFHLKRGKYKAPMDD